MSEIILLDGIRDRIRTAFSLDADSCLVSLDGRPPVGSPAQLFVGVSPAEVQGVPSMELDHHLEEYAVEITVSQRTEWIPASLAGEEVFIVDTVYRMNSLMWRIMVDLCDLPNAADLVTTWNTALEAAVPSATYGFSGYLRFAGAEKPVSRGAEWFGLSRSGGLGVGMSRTMKLFGVYRAEPWGNITR